MLILLVASLGALIPTAFYVVLVWWLDRYEKEPLRLLVLAFLWGAGPAAFLSATFELLVDPPLSALGGTGLTGTLIRLGLSAPLLEESFKGMALIGLVLLFHREFDDVLDGIVYGAMIGLGFAMTEDWIGYFLPILSGQGLAAGTANILLRTTIFGLNHGFWTGLTGAGMGAARLSRRWPHRLRAAAGGWVLAVLFHAMHNIGVTFSQQSVWPALGITVAVSWGGTLLLLVLASFALRRESQWIEHGLVEEVGRGALTAEEFDLLRSAGRRLRVRWRARRRGGRAAFRAVGDYYQCATDLAFKRHQWQQWGEEGTEEEIRKLQRELPALRSQAWPWLWAPAS